MFQSVDSIKLVINSFPSNWIFFSELNKWKFHSCPTSGETPGKLVLSNFCSSSKQKIISLQKLNVACYFGWRLPTISITLTFLDAPMSADTFVFPSKLFLKHWQQNNIAVKDTSKILRSWSERKLIVAFKYTSFFLAPDVNAQLKNHFVFQRGNCFKWRKVMQLGNMLHAAGVFYHSSFQYFLAWTPNLTVKWWKVDWKSPSWCLYVILKYLQDSC